MKRKFAVTVMAAALVLAQSTTALALTDSASAYANGGSVSSWLTSPTVLGTATRWGGRAYVEDTGIEFVQGTEDPLIGLPASVTETIGAINSGRQLENTGTGLDLTGYRALLGTTAVMTYESGSREEKTGNVVMPLYVPNLTSGLGTIQVLFYNNMTGFWELLEPLSINLSTKMIEVLIPNSGTFTIVYKR